LLSALMGRGTSHATVRRSVASVWRAGGTAGEALGRLQVEHGLEVPSASELTREIREIDRLGLEVIDLRDESYPSLLAVGVRLYPAAKLRGRSRSISAARGLRSSAVWQQASTGAHTAERSKRAR
jgi:hypothetical protein